MNGITLAGIITAGISILILILLSIWIGIIGLLVGFGLVLGGVLKKSNKE